MPDLTGRPRRDVERWLTSCGFRLAPVREVSSLDRSPGTVVGQIPLAGSPVRAREVVELSIAR
jgi:beta-lactam-binding protein with PASTA domain